MNRPAPAPLPPGSRVLADWWRKLAPFKPVRMGYAQAIVHSIEIGTRVTKGFPLSRPTRLALACLAVEGPIAAPTIARQFPLPLPIWHQLIFDLHGKSLIEQGESGQWNLTPAGFEALHNEQVCETQYDRQTFHFLQWGSATPALFLGLEIPHLRKGDASVEARFEMDWLVQCLNQSDAWKQEHEFPRDVIEILHPTPIFDFGLSQANHTSLRDAWRKVPVVNSQTACLVLLEGVNPNGEPGNMAFDCQSPGILAGATPWITFSKTRVDRLDEIWKKPSPEEWQNAWFQWCQQRNITAFESNMCRIECVDHRIRVKAPLAMIDRLRAQRSDAMRGDAWLLAKTGDLWEAGQIEMVKL